MYDRRARRILSRKYLRRLLETGAEGHEIPLSEVREHPDVISSLLLTVCTPDSVI